MNEKAATSIKEICLKFGRDSNRMMDIVLAVHKESGFVSDEAIDVIAEEVSTPRVEVDSLVSFYSFLSKTPKGKVVIRLCDDIIDRMNGSDVIAKALCNELKIGFGETTPDGKISLEFTPCIGMCDQAPSALVNDVVVTYLSTDKVRRIVKTLKKTGDPKKLVERLGDGNNANPLVKSMVHNNLREKGDVVFDLHFAFEHHFRLAGLLHFGA